MDFSNMEVTIDHIADALSLIHISIPDASPRHQHEDTHMSIARNDVLHGFLIVLLTIQDAESLKVRNA